MSVVLIASSCGASLDAANPVMPGADPHALVAEHTIWIYPTWSGGPGQRFFAFSSTNYVDWRRHGPVLDLKDVAWIGADHQPVHYAWAPSVLAARIPPTPCTTPPRTRPQAPGPITARSRSAMRSAKGQDIIRSSATRPSGEWRIVYHRWENQTGGGPYRGSRQVCVDSVEYDQNGLICPVVMTGGNDKERP